MHATSNPIQIVTHLPVSPLSSPQQNLDADPDGIHTAGCENLIEGYADLPEHGPKGERPRLHARIEALATLAGGIQGFIAFVTEDEHPDVLTSLTEDELNLVMQPKDQPVAGVTEWTHDEPQLLLISTVYEPYSPGVPAPAGEEIVWLHADTEERFLESALMLGVDPNPSDEDIFDAQRLYDEGAPF